MAYEITNGLMISSTNILHIFSSSSRKVRQWKVQGARAWDTVRPASKKSFVRRFHYLTSLYCLPYMRDKEPCYSSSFGIRYILQDVCSTFTGYLGGEFNEYLAIQWLAVQPVTSLALGNTFILPRQVSYHFNEPDGIGILVGLGGKFEPATWYRVHPKASTSFNCAPRAFSIHRLL